MFTLEGEYSGSSAPSVVITSNRSALGHALRTGSDGVYPSPVVDSIRNLTFTGFSAIWGNQDSDSSVMQIGMLENGLHNVHFIDNYADLIGAAYFDKLDGGMHDVHVINNRSLLGAAFDVNNLTGGVHNARFVGNRTISGALEIDKLQGGLNDSLFIGNRAQLPGDFPAYAELDQSAAASAAVLGNDVNLSNNTFLANTSSLANAQNPTAGARGAALVHGTDNASGASSVAIVSDANKRTLFYGNTHNAAGSGATPSAIHFESMWDYEVGEMPTYAGDPMTVNVAMNAASNGKILMLDPISSQPDNLPDLTINNPANITYGGITYDLSDPYDVKYSNLTVNLEKTGAGDWYLGGMSNLPGASTWNINQGTLTLTSVDYGGALGEQAAGINLSHGTTAAFNLAAGATLAGSGAITAKAIALNGNIRPGTWVNTGTLASDIRNDISDADIAAIDVVKASNFGTLTFNGNVTMTGAKYTANVGATGKNLLDVNGALTLDGSANELTLRLLSDTDVSNAAVISATGGITGSFDPLNIFVTAPSFLDTSGMTASASQVGNDIVVNTANASLNWNAAGSNTFALDADTPVFSINQNLTGTASLTASGTGTLFLNGENDYTGDTTVDAGMTLRVGETAGGNASVASTVEVASGAVIGGHGTLLGGLVLASGATVSPGASIGDMTVIGDIGAPGVIYEFDVNPDGSADHLIVNGEVKLAGSTLRVVHGGGSGDFGQSTTYTGIIQASGGVTGTFADIVNTLPLMDAQVDYLANSVDLTMTRNNTAFASLGVTGNQFRVGQALDALGNSHPVADAVSRLDAAGIRSAMDNLSGEIYASTRSALLTNRHLQNAIIQRTQSAAQQPLWVSTWGHNGHLSGNVNAARVDSRGLGLALGGDWRVSDALSAGVVLGYEDGRVKANARSARSDVDAVSVGGYVSANLGSVQVRGGVAYSHLDVDSQRNISVPTLQGQTRADYKGSKTQVFAEVSQAFAVNRLSVAPYVGVSQSWLHTQSVRETGHSAALDVAARTDHVTQSTLGLRLAVQLSTAAPVALTFDAAWARAFGDTDASTSNRFSGAGERFTAQGVEVGKNTALIGAGVQASLTPNAALNLGYQGQFGSRTRNHSAGLQLRVKF